MLHKGRRYITPLAILFICDSSRGARSGVIASKKVGSAVRRNRAKRLLREYFRKKACELTGRDILFLARYKLADSSIQELSNLLDEVLDEEIGKKDSFNSN